MGEKTEKTEATVLLSCIKAMEQLEGGKKAKQRLLRTLAAHFEVEWPTIARPPRVPFSGGLRYGTPFP
jgi:hypothetical protein